MPGPPVGVPGKRCLPEAAKRAVKLYTAWGKPEEAAEWPAKIKAQAKPR
jgi:hypothetical protein